MDDLGPPIAYIVLEEGTPVYDRGGERIGVVEQVLADEQLDIFEGVLVHTVPLPGRHLLADAEQIDALHEPSEQSAARRAGGEERVESPLAARLRRAWDRVTGRR
jgi:uncharacterized protein YrrD